MTPRGVARALGAVTIAVAAIACGADAPPYAACQDDLDCPEPSDACYELRYTSSDGSEAGGRFCSASCVEDADCPDEGHCVALVGDPDERFFCAAPCLGSADCYAGIACTGVEGVDGPARLCLP